MQNADKIIFLYKESYYNLKERKAISNNEYFKDVQLIHGNIVVALTQ